MPTCPNCHQPVVPGSRFCEHCGAAITPVTTPAAQPVRSQRSPRPLLHQTHRVKRTFWIIGTLAVLVVGFLGARFYTQQVGKPQQITTIMDDIAGNQSTDLAKHLISDDPSLEITGDSVQPFLDYTRQHPEYVKAMRSDLQKSGETRDQTFKLVTSGHTLGVLPIYKLQVTTMHPHLSTNVAHATIFANQTAITTAKNDHFTYIAGPLFPGHYTFKLSGGQAKANTTTDLIGRGDRNQSIVLKANPTKTATQVAPTQRTTTTRDSATSHHGRFESDLSSDAQEAIDAAGADFNFATDGERYTVSEPHPQVLEIKAYDADTDTADGTYRYDQVHSIVSRYNAATDKFETAE